MTDPRQSQPGSSGRDAIVSFEVTGPLGAAAVVTIEHRDADAAWSNAGSFSALAPCESSLRVGGPKDEMRFRVTGDADVRVLPPRWLP